jgi:hypothetical protein
MIYTPWRACEDPIDVPPLESFPTLLPSQLRVQISSALSCARNIKLAFMAVTRVQEHSPFPEIPHCLEMGITHRPDFEQPAVLPFVSIGLHLDCDWFCESKEKLSETDLRKQRVFLFPRFL